jgi:uncharacterized protein YhaN
VRYERLVIQAGSNSFTLDLHPRMTVIAGVGPLERESLIGELTGALSASRSGVHAELVQDDGRHIAVFRPEGGRHRVVDVNTASDVSKAYTGTTGKIDLLEHAGLDVRNARRRLRLAHTDLNTRSQGDKLVRQLAAQDQNRLWAAAEALRVAEETLQGEAEATGSVPEDAAVIERIEERHQIFQSAQDRHERFRRSSIVLALGSAGAALPVSFLSKLYALPLLLVASITVLVSVIFRSSMQKAARLEEEALAEAGAQSYLGFHLQRVNGLLSDDQARKRIMAAAEASRVANIEWRAIAGDVAFTWALEHHEEIQAAARVRLDVTALSTMSSTAPALDNDRTTDLARVLIGRLNELRSFGKDGESFPLILDDPLVGLPRSVKPALLELLGDAAGAPQLIFLTEDEDVASWARLEALTGALSILEPKPEHHEAPAPAEAPARTRALA